MTAGAPGAPPPSASHGRPLAGWPATLVLVVIVAAGGWWIGWRMARPLADGSPEAGFARDMSVHHAQAVDMALVMLERARDPQIRILAKDIALTQQAQIGQMSGWLDAWGLPATGRAAPMAWMGHEGMEAMPGMASRDELASLRRLPRAQAERTFLILMIAYHRGGVEMARALLERSRRPEVVRLAQAMVDSQEAEIAAMEALLER